MPDRIALLGVAFRARNMNASASPQHQVAATPQHPVTMSAIPPDGAHSAHPVDSRAMESPAMAIRRSDNSEYRPTSAGRSPERRRWLLALVLSVVAVAIAHLLDEIAWRTVRDLRVNDRDWGRFLRSIGYLPTWIAIAAVMWLEDRPSRGWGWRGGLLLAAPAFGGIAAELLKLIIRRIRPDETIFAYVFRAYSQDPLSTRGLGVPSSHVLVAFAGATALARLFPRARVVGYLLATGCALTRVLAVQHFLSDVVAAAALGWLIADPLSRWALAERTRAASVNATPAPPAT